MVADEDRRPAGRLVAGGAVIGRRSLFVDGPAPVTTNGRAWRWFRSRELGCLAGHKFKSQAFVFLYTGLPCLHREPPGHGPACGQTAMYFVFPHLRLALGIAVDPREFVELGERELTRDEVLAYLGVVLPEGLALPPRRP